MINEDYDQFLNVFDFDLFFCSAFCFPFALFGYVRGGGGRDDQTQANIQGTTD